MLFYSGPVASQAKFLKVNLDKSDFRRLPAEKSLPREERQRALKFLIHFTADLHHPLHVGNIGDRGGNDTQVRFFERASDLHRVWDSLIKDLQSREEALWLKVLDLTILSPVPAMLLQHAPIFALWCAVPASRSDLTLCHEPHSEKIGKALAYPSYFLTSTLSQ
jgi:hypothetical protein